MVHHTSNRHIQAITNNLKFIILDYLAANNSGILEQARKFFFLLPWKTMLDIVYKIWAPLSKLFAPPDVLSWLRACFGLTQRFLRLVHKH